MEPFGGGAFSRAGPRHGLGRDPEAAMEPGRRGSEVGGTTLEEEL